MNYPAKVDDPYERPIRSRYYDPLELVWLATARRFGLTIRRNPHIFSMSDGNGLLELGTRDTLDPDDNAAQMIFHEVCHWIVNGVETWHERDWSFAVTDAVDPREYACLRLQAALGDRYGMRNMFGVTGQFREYYDAIPADALQPFDDSDLERWTCDLAREALARADAPPWGEAVRDAMEATAAIRRIVLPFFGDYQTDLADDALPSWWHSDGGEIGPAKPAYPRTP